MMSDPIVFSDRNIVFDDAKKIDDPQVSDSLKVILNESMDLNDPEDSMIPRYSIIQREFQLEVWTLIIQKSGLVTFVICTTFITCSACILFGLIAVNSFDQRSASVGPLATRWEMDPMSWDQSGGSAS